MNNFSKIGIIGHVDHGRSALMHALISSISELHPHLEVEMIDPEVLDQEYGININMLPEPIKFEAPLIAPYPAYFKPPVTKRERRARERKNKNIKF